MAWRKYQTKVSILTWFSVIVVVGFGFEMKCPEPSQWKFRKKACVPPKEYSCLYDLKKREYVETCSEKTDFVKAGKRYVLTGGRDSADCDDSRYQPRKFWSNVTSDCEMLKSTCSEEGQITISDGSTTKDRACRCDFLNGFGSITTFKNICSCIPSLEDCNCYRTKYAESEIHKRDSECGKMTKTSKKASKYSSVRDSEIKLHEPRSSTERSTTVYTLENGGISKILNRRGNGYGYIMVVAFSFSALLAISGLAFVWKNSYVSGLIFVWKNYFGSNENIFESEHRILQDLIIDNWQDLQENGNAVTWKHEFKNKDFLKEYDHELNTSLPRALLVELVLTKCLQNMKKIEDIQLIYSVIFPSQVSATRYGKRKENAPTRESVESIKRYTEKLSKHREKIGESLNAENIVFIRCNLVQSRIIDVTENEKLIKLEEPCNSLMVQLIDLIINKLSAGSYQCFIQSLETINNKKSQESLLELMHILKNYSGSDDFVVHIGSTPQSTTLVEHVASTVYDSNIEEKDNFSIILKVENQDGHEVEEVYKHLQKESEDVNRICSFSLGGSVENTSDGSLIIDLQMMERNMQDYLKDCLRCGRVTTLVQMLFSEISLENILPFEKLYLKIDIKVNDDSSVLEPRSAHSSGITRFVIDNRSFLLEEMDTDAMKIALENYGFRIPTDEQYKRRKEKANHILSFVVKNALQTSFESAITEDKDNKFGYLRRRLEAYTQVYEAELQILRRNILLQFSQIVSNIDIYNIQDVLLDRNTIELQILNKIKFKYLTNREVGMASLLINILKSGDAVRAFVDALFIKNSFLAEKMLRCQSKFSVIETGPMVEIRERSPENRLLIEGYFIIDIIQEGILPPSSRSYSNRSLIRQKIDLIKKRQNLKNKIIEFENTLLNWLAEAKSVIKTLEDLAEELDAHFTRINKAKIGGSAAGIVGGVLGIIGLALTPVTFGASLGLTIAGGAVAGLGGATVGGSLIADNVLSKKTKTKAQSQLSDYSNSIVTIKETCLDLSHQIGKFEQLEDKFPDWVRFWTYFVRGQESDTSEFSWEQTQELLQRNLDNLDSAARFVFGEGVGSGVRIAGAAFRVTGTSLHVLSGVIGALMIPLDIFTIVDSAIDLHKKNKHETSKIIIQISQTLSKELPSEESIQTMIRFTINSI